MAIELATAYVSLVAETTKLEASVKSAFSNVGSQADKAGVDVGSRLAKTASKALKDGWKPDKDIMAGIPDTKLDRIGARIGQVIGKGIGGGLKARQLGKDFGDSFSDGARSVGLGKLITGWKSELSAGGIAVIGRNAGKSLMMGLTGAATIGAAGLVGTIGTALSKGFDRLLTIDKSKQKLKALGKSTAEVADIVKIVTDSVTGTPFSLDQAFATAVQAIGAGTTDIARFMKDVADAAGFAGTDIDRMGLIFNQVLAKGKLTGEEMMQLMEAGLPAKSWIQQSYNLTADQFDKMQQKGEITLDMLQKSIEDHAPGMAKTLGDSLQGSIDKMQTAIARLGADFLTAIFGGDASKATDTMADSVQKITDKLNDLDGWVKKNGPQIQNAFKAIGTGIEDVFKGVQKAINDVMSDIKWLATGLANVIGGMARFDEFMSKVPGIGDQSRESARQEAETLRQWEQNLREFGNPAPAGQQGGGPNAQRERRGLAPVAGTSASSKVLNYDQKITGQQFRWDCAPGSAEIILNGRAVIKSEDQLIAEMGTSTAGTPFGSGNISSTLNSSLPGANYQEKTGGAGQLFGDISRSVNAGYGAMLNYNTGPGGPVPVGIKGTQATPYSGPIGHYVAVMGVDDKDNSLLIADPKDGRQYWITADNAAELTKNRGYVAANPGGGWVNMAGTFDTGGWLPDGTNLIMNNTGKPELVMNADQQQQLTDVAGIDPAAIVHGSGNGAPPGPMQPGKPGQPGQPNGKPSALESGLGDLLRTQGFMPANAANTGVAGTSSLAGVLNLGNQIVGSVIDTGSSLLQQAVTAAIMAGAGAAAASSGGGGAAAAVGVPIAAAAANYGIQMGTQALKRGVTWGYQMAAIGADSLIEQIFPFGAPRWLSYDYTTLMPQLGIQQALTSTIEKQGTDAINNAFNPQNAPAAGQKPVAPVGLVEGAPAPQAGSPAGPVNPATMPGATSTAPPAPFAEPPPTAQVVTPAPAVQATTPPVPGVGSLLGLFDDGGWLMPGDLALNMTSRPEPVLSPQQWEAIASSGSGQAMTGAPLVQNLYAADMNDAIRQLQKVQNRNVMQYAGRP